MNVNELKFVRKDEIDYPSKDNPRIEHLSADSPHTIELSKSIERNGLQYPPILYLREDGKYEAIDGDRRLVAVFDVLGWDQVQASIRDTPSKSEIYYLRMASNWDKLDFSAIEKGAYIYAIIEDEMSHEGLDIEESWGHREIRNEYMRRVADKLAKPVSSIGRYVGIWRQIPVADRKLIARNRDEIRLENKITFSKAMKITTIGRKIGDVEGAWRLYVPKETIKMKKPLGITGTELEITRQAVRSGQIRSLDQLRAFREGGEADEWTQAEFLMLKSEAVAASMLAAALKTEISKVYRGCILLGTNYAEELGEIIKEHF